MMNLAEVLIEDVFTKAAEEKYHGLTRSQLDYFLKKLGPKVTEKEFLAGILVEREHGPNGPMGGVFNVTNGDAMATAKIAAAHLAELPDYYTRLAKMEAEGEKANE